MGAISNCAVGGKHTDIYRYVKKICWVWESTEYKYRIGRNTKANQPALQEHSLTSPPGRSGLHLSELRSTSVVDEAGYCPAFKYKLSAM